MPQQVLQLKITRSARTVYIYIYVLYLSENKQRLVPLNHTLIGFYNRDAKCLLRGTDWVFK